MENNSLFNFLENSFILGQAEQSSLSSFTPLIMMVGIIAIFYFLMIRPQQKRQKELKAKIQGMQKGDKIVTVGGIYATVVVVKEDRVTAKISEDVKVDISKAAVASVSKKSTE